MGGVAIATRQLRVIKPCGYAALAYLSLHFNATPKPSFLRPYPYPSSPFSPRLRRCLCTATLPSGETNKVAEFRKKLKVADVKGDDVGMLGHTIVLKGWVRTLRLQSSVSFLEVSQFTLFVN